MTDVPLHPHADRTGVHGNESARWKLPLLPPIQFRITSSRVPNTHYLTMNGQAVTIEALA